MKQCKESSTGALHPDVFGKIGVLKSFRDNINPIVFFSIVGVLQLGTVLKKDSVTFFLKNLQQSSYEHFSWGAPVSGYFRYSIQAIIFVINLLKTPQT